MQEEISPLPWAMLLSPLLSSYSPEEEHQSACPSTHSCATDSNHSSDSSSLKLGHEINEKSVIFILKKLYSSWDFSTSHFTILAVQKDQKPIINFQFCTVVIRKNYDNSHTAATTKAMTKRQRTTDQMIIGAAKCWSKHCFVSTNQSRDISHCRLLSNCSAHYRHVCAIYWHLRGTGGVDWKVVRRCWNVITFMQLLL